MLSPAQIDTVIRRLDHEFPNPQPPLTFHSPFELLVAVVLSAQCTDERVNQTTPALFAVANTPRAMARMDFESLRTLIHSCGYHNQKAKNLLATAKILTEAHGGEVPRDLKTLTALPGVGRKSAGVVLSQAFGIPAFPVDTHVFRVTNRIGIVKEPTREKTADALEARVARERWIPFHLQLIFHGRKTCKAQKPNCGGCPIKDICQWPEKSRIEQQSKNRG